MEAPRGGGTPQEKKGDTLMNAFRFPMKMDYWSMRPDGTGKQRVTSFNDPSSPQYMPVDGGVAVADFDWGSDGKRIVAKVRCGRRWAEGVYLIEFDGP
jgi:hypothetical protein